jgi:microcystin-dependent protein
MSEPFLAEIKMVGFNFAPRAYAKCDGQIMNIQQNTSLFSLLGITYGGNGTTTFALPNLGGNVPIHAGSGPGLTPRVWGEMGGSATVTLATFEMPSHTHALWADPEKADDNDPGSTLKLATSVRGRMYNTGNLATMHPASITPVGGGQPHENQQPYLVVNFVIALQGIFPSHQT